MNRRFLDFKMEKRDVLKICSENGFFLDRDMLDFFVELDDEVVVGIIEKLKGFGFFEKILTRVVFDRYKDRLGDFLGNGEEGVGINVLREFRGGFNGVEAADFVSYFRARFEALRDILIEKDLENLSSIRRIGAGGGVYTVIGMVFSKRITKNKNLLIEIEDLTGRSVVLVNRENKDLFERARNLLLDDVLAFKVLGSGKMLFVNDFIYPDVGLSDERFGDRDEFVAFSGDFHVGSKNFLEGNLMRFVDWLNGEVGDERQRNLAKKVNYLVLSGNNIEGVGVYPKQEEFLSIKGCCGQYEKLAGILGRIRKDVEIVMCPGQHDSVWVGEPQPVIGGKWGGSLNKLDNLKLVSNPVMVDIGGLKILVYGGGSVGKFKNLISGGGALGVGGVMGEILKRRHLAPVYGEMDIVPNKLEDDLVLGDLPDVFVVGGQHCASVSNYKNILTISTSSWVSQSGFGDDDSLDSCRVPILNLKSREVKILDFSSTEEGVCWEEGDDLVCDLGGEKNR